MPGSFKPTYAACPRRGAATKRVTRFALLIVALQTAACANHAKPSEGIGNMTVKKCDPEQQLMSDQAIKDVLTHNLFSFVDDQITVDRPVERFDEGGSYSIVRARVSVPTVGDYRISDGIVTIRSPQSYFNMPSRRILVKSPTGEIIFCDVETGSRLPLAAVAR